MKKSNVLKGKLDPLISTTFEDFVRRYMKRSHSHSTLDELQTFASLHFMVCFKFWICRTFQASSHFNWNPNYWQSYLMQLPNCHFTQCVQHNTHLLFELIVSMGWIENLTCSNHLNVVLIWPDGLREIKALHLRHHQHWFRDNQ